MHGEHGQASHRMPAYLEAPADQPAMLVLAQA
jgi:hypothetical protein